MRPVRVVHDGDGVYRYGHPGQVIGKLRFDPDTLSLERIEGPGPSWVDPWLTAALAVRRHWQVTGALPDRLEVAVEPEDEEMAPAAAPRPAPEQVVRSGRLRRPDLKPVSMREIARRNRPADNRSD